MATAFRPWGLRPAQWPAQLCNTRTWSFSSYGPIRKDQSSPQQIRKRYTQQEMEQVKKLVSQEIPRAEWTKLIPGRSFHSIQSALRSIDSYTESGPRLFWSDDELRTLEIQKKKGATTAELMKLLPGRSVGSIDAKWRRVAARDARGKIVHPSRREITPEDRQLMLDCRERKMTWKQIQQQYFPQMLETTLKAATYYYQPESRDAVPNTSKWSEDERMRLTELLREETLSMREIAKRLNRSYHTVYSQSRAILKGAPAASARVQKNWSKDEVARLREMRGRGDSFRTIAAFLSRTEWSLRRKLERLEATQHPSA